MCASQRLYVSTASLKDNRDLSRVLAVYHDLGFAKVEISALHHYQEFNDLVKLVNRFQSQGMAFIYHNYFPRPVEDIVLNVISLNKENRDKSKQLIAQVTQLARQTNVDLYCFHPGYLGDPKVLANGMFDFAERKPWDKMECLKIFREDFMAFYHDLKIDLPGQKFYLGIENLFPPSSGDNFSIFCSYPDIAQMFGFKELADSNMGILVDLGHLAISANILNFDRDKYLDQVIQHFGDRIYEVHLSENDGREDLHEQITATSWQLNVLSRFKETGGRLQGQKTRFCIESRGLTEEELKESYTLVQSQLEFCGI